MTHIDDLPDLKDEYDSFQLDDDFTDTSYHEDFLETIDIFIDEFVNHNIIDYQESDFEDRVKEAVYTQITELYNDQINYLDISLDDTIDECVYLYFMKHSCPRSYSKSIVLSPTVPSIITEQLIKIQNIHSVYI